MIILVALVIIVLLVGAVFSVDVAYMHLVRAELRTATDAAARAGSETLARTQDQGQAVRAAIDVASRNSVAGNGLTLSTGDVKIGSIRSTNSGKFQFVEGQAPFTAVRITGDRSTGSVDGAVPLFFARIFSASQFEPTQVATASANVKDVALVLDVSGSMRSRSGSTTRIQALINAVNIFITEVESSSPNTLLSLTTYSSRPSKRIDLTDNFNSIRTSVNKLRARGTTAIGNALTMGSDSLVNDTLNRNFAAKTVVIMTDGNHNTGPSPATTVNTAVSRNQQVHTITFSSGANQTLMRNVAQATSGGLHIHANDAADLAEAFREIARALSVTLVE